MGFIKKQSAGFYFISLSAVLGVVGVIFYLVNCGTAYFAKMGTSPVVIACAAAAVAVEILLVVLSQRGSAGRLPDLLFVASGVLLAVAAVTLVGARVVSIAAIFTFENNAQTMADLSSAIAGIACLLLALFAGIIASFCKVAKD